MKKIKAHEAKPCAKNSRFCSEREKPCKPKGSLPKRVSSGVPGFDKLVQGGFKDKSINLVVGGPGSGKTIFTLMFLIDGFKKGEPGLYITFEEKKEKLYEDMLSFGWDLKEYEKKGLFSYLEYTPEQVKRLLIEGGGTVDSIVTKMKATRLVIDSVSSFALLYREELAKKEAALALFEIIDKWSCTALLTSQDTGMDGVEVSAALQFEVDSITILYHEKKKGLRVRALEVLKMRGTKIPNETSALKINGCGIEVLPQKVDF